MNDDVGVNVADEQCGSRAKKEPGVTAEGGSAAFMFEAWYDDRPHWRTFT